MFARQKIGGAALVSELTRSGLLDTEALLRELKLSGARPVTPTELTRSLEAACDAANRAYSPYIKPNRDSGVAILGSDGSVVVGTRVENACTNLSLDASSAALWRAAFYRLPNPLAVIQFRVGEGFEHKQGTLLHGASGEALRNITPGALGIEFDHEGLIEKGRIGALRGKGAQWQTPNFNRELIPEAEQILLSIERSHPGVLNLHEVMRLRQAAIHAATAALAPYSDFPVGAALLTYAGEVYDGANIEVESSGLSICAERNAVGTMVSQGAKVGSKFGDQLAKAVMVFAPTGAATVTPCGGCRQVLYEFGPDALVISINLSAQIKLATARELLPHGFGPSTMVAAKNASEAL